jgi:hypothetical protein
MAMILKKCMTKQHVSLRCDKGKRGENQSSTFVWKAMTIFQRLDEIEEIECPEPFFAETEDRTLSFHTVKE